MSSQDMQMEIRMPTTILIAIDDKTILEKIQIMISSLNSEFSRFEVFISTSANEFISMLIERSIDIVLIGCQYRYINSRELISIGETVSPKTSFVAVVTTIDNEIDNEWFSSSGAIDCILIDNSDIELFKKIVYSASNRKIFEFIPSPSRGDIRPLMELRLEKKKAKRTQKELSAAKEYAMSALKKAEESEQKYRIMVDNSPSGIWHIDINGETIFLNGATKRIFGLEGDGSGLNFSSVLDPVDYMKSREILGYWAEGFIFETEFVIRDKVTSALKHIVVSGTRIPYHESHPQSILVNIVDITERKLAEEKIEYMSNHDALTGLPNRHVFLRRLKNFINHVPPHTNSAAIMFLDLDNFKHINDTAGHPTGDQLIREAAERIQQTLKKSDVFARLGGDEFAILCINKTTEDIIKLSNQIIEVVSRPYMIDGMELHSTVSIGIAIYPHDTYDITKLVSFADMALYTAKDNGRGTYHFFDKKMGEELQRRKIIEMEMREALEKNEFTLYFQPQIDTSTLQLIGVESLIRWRHPIRGLVFPGEFIPVAEQCGLISQLGEWVIKEAFRQAKEWDEKYPGKNIRIAINLSALQFRQKKIISLIRELKKLHDVRPELIEFEITESMVMDSTEYAIEIMELIKEEGFGLSIDDFGTGFSSLAYLKKFPVDSLKIDRSFVTDILEDGENAIIASSIIALAHNLNLKVVAEGVEHEEQVTWLRKNNCDCIQGYLFGKPMEASVFESKFIELPILL